MSKFKLICDYSEDSQSHHVITHEFDSVYLPDVLEHFEGFLKGCGFHFSGVLDIVSDETETPTDHSQHYFDTERNR